MKSEKQGKHLLRRFLSYYKPHMKLFLCDMAATMSLSLIGIVYPVLTRKMLNDFIPDRKYKLICWIFKRCN